VPRDDAAGAELQRPLVRDAASRRRPGPPGGRRRPPPAPRRAGRAAAPGPARIAPVEAGSGAAPGDGTWLLSGGTLFADGSLSQRSGTLARLAGAARARLSPAEASRLDLRPGDRVELKGSGGAI